MGTFTFHLQHVNNLFHSSPSFTRSLRLFLLQLTPCFFCLYTHLKRPTPWSPPSSPSSVVPPLPLPPSVVSTTPPRVKVTMALPVNSRLLLLWLVPMISPAQDYTQ